MVGFEPTISSTPSWRIAKLSHILQERQVGIEPTPSPWQGDILPIYDSRLPHRFLRLSSRFGRAESTFLALTSRLPHCGQSDFSLA